MGYRLLQEAREGRETLLPALTSIVHETRSCQRGVDIRKDTTKYQNRYDAEENPDPVLISDCKSGKSLTWTTVHQEVASRAVRIRPLANMLWCIGSSSIDGGLSDVRQDSPRGLPHSQPCLAPQSRTRSRCWFCQITSPRYLGYRNHLGAHQRQNCP
jgi:hypothetical protein